MDDKVRDITDRREHSKESPFKKKESKGKSTKCQGTCVSPKNDEFTPQKELPNLTYGENPEIKKAFIRRMHIPKDQPPS